MSRLLAALLLLTGLAASHLASAGGSAVPVVVVSLSNGGGTDYTLVVEPIASNSTPDPYPYPDPYMASCSRFTVVGTYSRLAGLALTQPPMVTRDAHIDALRYLRNAAATHATIQLGWMGSGFLVSDPEHPCVGKSR